MDYTCMIGESDMKDFTNWWESHLPSYLILYCRQGEAQILLQFETYHIGKGMMIFISPDMFPAFLSRSQDLMMFYCLIDRDYAEQTLYGVPKQFYDCQYLYPIIDGGREINIWTKILEHIDSTYKDYQCRREIIKNVINNIYFVYYNLWQQQYGNKKLERELKKSEQLCMKFYNLVFDHSTEQRDIQFYANRLCITSNYLAMLVRQVCNESPKQAIDRQVILEMKYVLKNTTMNTEQIALRFNFPDTSYMCRFFRKRTGTSMSEYRNSTNAK